MMKIAKDFRWEMGHRLQCHKGKCFNLHGHSYKMTIEFEGEIDEATGMVMDYFDVKDVVGPLVERLDHSVAVWDKDVALIKVLDELNSRKTVLPFETTAENLCNYFLAEIKKAKLPSNIKRIKVRVCETENTYAESGIEL